MRLIDADALIERLKKDNPQTSKLKWAQILADNAPTIDAEPVVRCKDCRYWSDTICERFEEERIMFMDDYCSYGERKDESEVEE